MKSDEVFNYIVARAQDDVAVNVGLFNAGLPLVTGMSWIRMPDGKSFPYITMNHVGIDTTDEAFGFDVLWWRWDFHIWVDAVNGAKTPAHGTAIACRLYGDATSQSSNLPTYGFHRHEFGTTTTDGFKMGSCRRIGTAEAHERDVWHWIETYEVLLQR